MGKKFVSRIDVFAELVNPNSTFDYDKCNELLGDRYNSFIEFCQAVQIIPEEISHMKVTSFPGDIHDPVTFEIELDNGDKIVLEK